LFLIDRCCFPHNDDKKLGGGGQGAGYMQSMNSHDSPNKSPAKKSSRSSQITGPCTPVLIKQLISATGGIDDLFFIEGHKELKNVGSSRSTNRCSLLCFVIIACCSLLLPHSRSTNRCSLLCFVIIVCCSYLSLILSFFSLPLFDSFRWLQLSFLKVMRKRATSLNWMMATKWKVFYGFNRKKFI
jgi:hypothetical protein